MGSVVAENRGCRSLSFIQAANQWISTALADHVEIPVVYVLALFLILTDIPWDHCDPGKGVQSSKKRICMLPAAAY